MQITTNVQETTYKKKAGTYTYGTIHISRPDLVKYIGKTVKVKISK